MISFFGKPNDRVRTPIKQRKQHDFEFSLFALLCMLLILVLGILVQSLVGGLPPIGLIARAFLAIALSAVVYWLLPYWYSLPIGLAVAMATVFATAVHGGLLEALVWDPSNADFILLAFLITACFWGPSLQVVVQWDKVVVLRLGRFHKVHGPGPFFMLPLLDRCAATVDTRIRVTDFSAEKILTRDTVPVHIDALAFWMIWDAKKAILEVENFLEAVTLSAQTALRDSIGKYSLSTILSERETLYNEIQSILDAKTNPWGISILSVEFVDIELPAELQDVMSRQAQAEREKEARMMLGQAEQEVAAVYCAAAAAYKGNPEALNLRAMSMVYDSMKTRGSMVLLPSGVLENMNMGSVLGVVKAAGPQPDTTPEG
ncbi:MAG: slipin family protein [Spirochaetes bacterium]|nr:slipin family protein [Spirochaetota bacterium]MBU0956038.1 slipin family protein [Spirochaetota bacterium]